VKIRYKAPQGTRSELSEFAASPQAAPLRATSEAFRFSAAVASFGLLLRGSDYAGRANFSLVDELARGAMGTDLHGYRREFVHLVEQAARM
jgi:Ca-activated chloride channel homolog